MAQKPPGVEIDDGIFVLSREDAMPLFDARARAELGISGEEFIRRWRAGEYEDPDEIPGVVELIMLLSFVIDLPEDDGAEQSA